MIKKRYLIPVIIFMLIISGFAWWNRSVSFLKSVSADEISVISVRNGQNGNCFDITNKEDIGHIIGNIQKPDFHKSGLSLLNMGTFLTLSFYTEDGRLADRVIVNSNKNIRKDPFFYQADSDALQVTDYISALEQSSCACSIK